MCDYIPVSLMKYGGYSLLNQENMKLLFADKLFFMVANKTQREFARGLLTTIKNGVSKRQRSRT